MTENEKQYRDDLLLGLRKEGFINDSTESEIAFKLGYEKAINYTNCCTELCYEDIESTKCLTCGDETCLDAECLQ